MIEWRAYTPADAALWDEAVRDSRNGTFLFERGFMDYHADRFADASLIFTRKGRIAALLPQTRHGVQWRSHGGLTYGGLVLAPETTMPDVLAIHACIAEAAAAAGIARICVTPVPHIYHAAPCEEERYALFRAGARVTACGVDSVIALDAPLAMAKMRRRTLAKAESNGLVLDRACPTNAFHAMLSANLATRHDTAPVHSAAEMALLQARFPRHIACWGCRDDEGVLLAGLWLFDTGRCAHAQYIASSERGRTLGALDHLFAAAIAESTGRAAYFSFGTSNEPGDGGEDGLNPGLIRQKTSFGARAIVYETFEYDVTAKET